MGRPPLRPPPSSHPELSAQIAIGTVSAPPARRYSQRDQPINVKVRWLNRRVAEPPCAIQLVHIIERDIIRERTQAGLAAARARVRNGGRPTALFPVKRRQATKMIAEGTPIVEVAETVGVSRSTLYRQLRPMPGPGF